MMIRRLSEESIATLRRLLGVCVFTIRCPNLDAARAHLAAMTFAMLVEKDRFFNFTCEWSETPTYLNDSWLIKVSESADPVKISRNSDGAYVWPCTISMSSAQPIERIEIFELQSEVDDERPEESTIYDHALLFHSMGG